MPTPSIEITGFQLVRWPPVKPPGRKTGQCRWSLPTMAAVLGKIAADGPGRFVVCVDLKYGHMVGGTQLMQVVRRRGGRNYVKRHRSYEEILERA